MREFLKKLIHIWPWPLTLNERYDRQTKAVIKKVLKPDSLCIDVGCFKGDILQAMIDSAPNIRHKAFEPVPQQYAFLKEQFGNKADIFPYALGHENKQTTFHHVVSNPTYSGLKQRQYKGEETIHEIAVEVRKMDDVIGPDTPVTLIKIDVEGGEHDVMQGAEGILNKWHPYLIFEHGIGGADKYGVKPGDVYDLLVSKLGYRICLMGDYLKKDMAKGFTRVAFEDQFWKGTDCYFLAVHDKNVNE
jgi:FkbM family methyltransferase